MELKAYPRTRRQKLDAAHLPAVAYNKDTNMSLALNQREFDRVFRQQGTNGLIDIAVEGGETLPALVKAVQMNKRTRQPMHVDFYLVTYGQEIEVTVPLHTTGRSQGEREGGLVDIVLHNVPIVAPGPRRIPAELTVDITELKIGDHVRAGDIALPEGVRLAVGEDVQVISVLPPRLSEEELEAEAEAAQVQGLVAAGELSEEQAAAILEGEASLDEVVEAASSETADTDADTEQA